MSDKMSFRDSRFYPVFFMIILSAILTFILATSYQLSKERVKMFREVSMQTSLLSLFIPELPELNGKTLAALEAEEISKLYKTYIVRKSLNAEYNYYKFSREGQELGYIFPVSVKGLWSTIHLLVAIKSDFSEYIGIKVINQGETPGLGARITEAWFQEQFSGKAILQADGFVTLKLIDENEQPASGMIRQITGATVSSRAVVSGVREKLKILYEQYFSKKSKGDK
ncbi:MAG: FMN-binding protein [Candidatus Cloacimonetes bacterium]|nr:FMN-binding protein [Candidatus Cloacimonadota bacterium]